MALSIGLEVYDSRARRTVCMSFCRSVISACSSYKESVCGLLLAAKFRCGNSACISWRPGLVF